MKECLISKHVTNSIWPSLCQQPPCLQCRLVSPILNLQDTSKSDGTICPLHSLKDTIAHDAVCTLCVHRLSIMATTTTSTTATLTTTTPTTPTLRLQRLNLCPPTYYMLSYHTAEDETTSDFDDSTSPCPARSL